MRDTSELVNSNLTVGGSSSQHNSRGDEEECNGRTLKKSWMRVTESAHSVTEMNHSKWKKEMIRMPTSCCLNGILDNLQQLRHLEINQQAADLKEGKADVDSRFPLKLERIQTKKSAPALKEMPDWD
nr:hypothetical protein Iba_chr01cCG6400 [Ipomoea batatas]